MGNLFIADYFDNRIRRVDASTGIIKTVAGNGNPFGGFSGDGGPPTSASLAGPIGVVVDGTDNLFIADTFNNRIRRVDAKTGIITTVAGKRCISDCLLGDGGPATSAALNFPTSVAVDGVGNLFIADGINNRIRRVDASTGIITTVAGDGFRDESFLGRFSGDGGPATSGGLNLNTAYVGVAIETAGNLFIPDTHNGAVRIVKGIGVGQRN